MILKKIKRISKSQPKHNNFEEYKNCSDDEEYQKDCDKCFIRSNIHKVYHHRFKTIHTIFI